MKEMLQKHRYMLLVLLLFISANIFAASRLLFLKDYADLIALCYPEGTLPASAWEQFEQNDVDEEEKQKELFSQAGIWKSLREITVSEEQTGRKQKVSCYQIRGQTAAVLGKELVCGRYFVENEDHVCLLDRDTVRKLFGSEDVLGMEVRINGAGWQIMGVLDGDRAICVIPSGKPGREPVSEGAVSGGDSGGNGGNGGGSAAGENVRLGGSGGGLAAGGNSGSGGAAMTGNAGGGFDGAAVRKKEIGQSSNLTFSRIEALFGSSGGQRMDGQLYYVTACFIYFGILGLIFMIAGIALGRRRRQKWMTAAGMAAAVGFLWLGIRYAAPGSDYLPTYWSDFEFFSRIFQEKARQIGELALHQEFSVWQNIFRAWQQVIGAGILDCVLCIISIFGMMKK